MDRSLAERLAALLAVVGAGAGVLARMRSYSLLGFDAYPLIASARMQTPRDFFGTFSEELLAGYLPVAFYRPVLNLSVAADYALWELWPFGYHATTAILFAACALSVFVLAKRLLGRTALAGPWSALLVFVLLPVHLEVLPVLARRAELLCALFSICALSVEIASARRGRSGRRVLLATGFTALAVGSKELGAVVPPLVFSAAFYLAVDTILRLRLRRALGAALPHAAAVGLVVAVRTAALNGLGGYAIAAPADVAERFPWILGLLVVRISSFGGATPESELPVWLLVSLAGLVVLSIAALAASLMRAAASARPPATRSAQAAAIGLTWIALAAALYSVTYIFRTWYLLVPGVALSLVTGAAVHGLVAAARRPRGAQRAGAVVALLLLGAWMLREAGGSMLFHRYSQWDRATAATQAYLGELAQQIRNANDGEVVEAPPPPIWLPADPAPIGPRLVPPLAPYSVRGWAAVAFPDRKIDFREPSQGSEGDATSEGLVIRFRDLERDVDGG